MTKGKIKEIREKKNAFQELVNKVMSRLTHEEQEAEALLERAARDLVPKQERKKLSQEEIQTARELQALYEEQKEQLHQLGDLILEKIFQMRETAMMLKKLVDGREPRIPYPEGYQVQDELFVRLVGRLRNAYNRRLFGW